MKGRIIGIVLFLAFVAPVGTAFVVLQYQKKQVKRAVKWKMIDGIDREELVVLKLTNEEKESELRWEHSREVEYRGEMYDIVETSQKGDTTYFWVWWDNEETELNKKLDQLVADVFGDNPKNREGQDKLAKFYKNLFRENPKTLEPLLTTVQKQYIPYSENFSSFKSAPPSPPPRMV
ncbi:MAG: hypothetical protein ABR574_07855 [Cryomorphaceae bacterium]